MTQPEASPTGLARGPDRGNAGRSYDTIKDTATRILHHPANRERRIRALVLYLLWQIWQRSVRLPWTIRLGEALRIRLYPHSVVAAFVLYYRIPDFEEMSFIRAYLGKNELFVDVGANVGVYSLWASQTEGVEVLAFEPSTVTHVRTTENVELNRLSDRIRVVHKAVGAQRGVARLTTGMDAINQVIAEDVDASEVVEITTLDHELGPRRPAIIKIDVEGKELEVLHGGRELISRHRPALIIEVNDPVGLTEVLENLAYRAWSYDPATGALAPTHPVLGTNVIALADVDDARARIAAV